MNNEYEQFCLSEDQDISQCDQIEFVLWEYHSNIITQPCEKLTTIFLKLQYNHSKNNGM